MRRSLVGIVGSLVLSACSGENGDPVAATASAPAPTPAVATTTTAGVGNDLRVPRVVRRSCSQEQRQSVFDVLCPTRFPGVTRGANVVGGVKLALSRWPRTGASWYGLSLNALGTRPAFFHLELLGGKWEGERPGWSMRAWLGENKRRIGAMTVGGRRGVLYDHPQSQGVFNDHLTFIWKKGEITYAASLHIWTPRRETRRVLATIIAGLRPTLADDR